MLKMPPGIGNRAVHTQNRCLSVKLTMLKKSKASLSSGDSGPKPLKQESWGEPLILILILIRAPLILILKKRQRLGEAPSPASTTPEPASFSNASSRRSNDSTFFASTELCLAAAG